MFAAELEDFSSSYPLQSDYLHVLNTHLPIEWVNNALSMTSHATVRRRKIQPQDVLRLVIGMSLLRQESIHTVAEQLALNSKQLDNALLSAKS
ncbi:transposase domain-containing protein [Photobacterium sp. TLY01]|uniref:transposase domain-containing protein n=1 Tax=Photobacterium sp. TLY01 TaxID=2907534 RepID=UPI001F2CE4A2|nr:transposase domain-containing protein [Photobacterium sp. TLY01]UIP30313.1 transposase domain-containing protein [Photobacterium sp. TLY01]